MAGENEPGKTDDVVRALEREVRTLRRERDEARSVLDIALLSLMSAHAGSGDHTGALEPGRDSTAE